MDNTPNFDFDAQGTHAFEDLVESNIKQESYKVKEKELSPDFKFYIEANFHRSNLLQIKQALGGKCTFLAHESESGKSFIKAIMKNETGGKDTVRFALGSTAAKMNESDYHELYNQLKNGDYASR